MNFFKKTFNDATKSLNDATGKKSAKGASEANEDPLDKAVDFFQSRFLGMGNQDNETPAEQKTDEQISDGIRSLYKKTTGQEFFIKDQNPDGTSTTAPLKTNGSAVKKTGSATTKATTVKKTPASVVKPRSNGVSTSAPKKKEEKKEAEVEGEEGEGEEEKKDGEDEQENSESEHEEEPAEEPEVEEEPRDDD